MGYVFFNGGGALSNHLANRKQKSGIELGFLPGRTTDINGVPVAQFLDYLQWLGRRPV